MIISLYLLAVYDKPHGHSEIILDLSIDDCI